MIIIPMPPSLNTYYRHVGSKVLISAAGRKYRREIEWQALREHWPNWGAARIALRLDIYPPDKRRRDLDNTCKAVLDALEKARLFDDDGQIDELHLRRMSPTAGGQVAVHVSQIVGEEPC